MVRDQRAASQVLVDHHDLVDDLFVWAWDGPDLVATCLVEHPGAWALLAFDVADRVGGFVRARGADWHPRRIVLQDPVVRDWSLAGLTVASGAAETRLVLDPDRFDEPFPDHNPVVESLLRDQLSALRRAVDTDPVVRVRRALVARLPLAPSADAIARALGCSRRTLHRQLAAAGTSFQDVLEALRRELAAQWLGVLPQQELAERLGYSEARAFRRAFQRWHGVSPSAWLAARA